MVDNRKIHLVLCLHGILFKPVFF